MEFHERMTENSCVLFYLASDFRKRPSDDCGFQNGSLLRSHLCPRGFCGRGRIRGEVVGGESASRERLSRNHREEQHCGEHQWR